jgi:HD superfamily phosphohydrolase
MMKNKKDEEKVLKDTKKAADHKKDDLPVSSTIEIKLAEKETELNDAKKQLLMQETKELEEDIIEQNEAIEKLKQQEDIIKKLEEFKKENIDVGYFGKKEGESSKKIDIPLIDGEKDYIGGKETVTTKNKIELLFRKLYKRSKSPMQQILM